MDDLADPLNWALILVSAFLGLVASTSFGHLFKPDHHGNDAAMEATVRLAHLGVGLAFVLLPITALWLVMTGAPPDRFALALACIAGAGAFELAQYLRFEAKAMDKIKDTADMAAAPVACCASFQWESGLRFAADILPALLISVVFAASVAYGWVVRR